MSNSGSGLLGGGFIEPILAEPDDKTRPFASRRRSDALQRGRGPGSTAVGAPKGHERDLPPKRQFGLGYMELG